MEPTDSRWIPFTPIQGQTTFTFTSRETHDPEALTPVDGTPLQKSLQTPAQRDAPVDGPADAPGPEIPRPIRCILSLRTEAGNFFIECVDYPDLRVKAQSEEDAVEGMSDKIREMFSKAIKYRSFPTPAEREDTAPLEVCYRHTDGGIREFLTIRGLPERVELVVRRARGD